MAETRSLSLAVLLALFATLTTSGGAIAQGANQSRECTIIDVAVYTDRVSIQCGTKGGKIGTADFYAVAIDSPMAPLLLDLGLDSLKRKVKVYFTNDTSDNPPGCAPSNCRRLNGIIAFER